MKAVDPAIRFLACGAEWRVVGTEWNGELIRRAAPELTTITHHVLNGGMVNERTDRMDLFHSFMGYATSLGDKYLALAKEMEDGGVRDPKVAITELQLFAHYTGPAGIALISRPPRCRPTAPSARRCTWLPSSMRPSAWATWWNSSLTRPP